MPDPPGPSFSLDSTAGGSERSDETNPPPGDTLPAPTEDGAAPPERLGDYELSEELGRGGMGAVYRARHLKLRREVALKVLRGGEAANALDVERFQIEARAAARLQHSNIVRIHEVGREGSRWFLAMDLIEGGSLIEAVRRDGPLAPAEAARIAETLARALEHAHGEGILHRDLKPHNVLIDAEGTPFLTDFGLAKDVDRTDQVTRTGDILGTPAYMSPEQAEGGGSNADARADVYGLGATLYCLLTGEPPHTGETLAAVINAILNHAPVPVRQRRPEVPRDLETICLKCLEREPDQRYPTADALADDLQRFREHRAIQARPPTAWERLRKYVRRNRALATAKAVAAAAVLLAVVGAAIFAQQLARERDATEVEAKKGEERDAIAQAALQALVTELDTQLSDTPGAQAREARARLLEHAVQALARLQTLEGDDAPPSQVSAEAHGRIGDLFVRGGEAGKARDAYTRSLAIVRELDRRDPGQVATQRLLARTLTAIASIQQVQDPLAARRALNEALAVHTQLAAREGESPEKLLRQDRRDRLQARLALGQLQHSAGEVDAAATTFRAALLDAEALLKADIKAKTGDPLALRLATRLRRKLGAAAQEQGDLNQALVHQTAALKATRRLASFGDSSRLARDLIDSLTRTGQLHLTLQQPARAKPLFEEALTRARKALKRDPQSAQAQRDLATALTFMGEVKEAGADPAAAASDYAEALRLTRALRTSDPNDVDLARAEALLLGRQGLLQHQGGDSAGLATVRQAIAAYEALVEKQPNSIRLRSELAGNLQELGRILQARQEPRAALAAFQRALTLHRALVAKTPTLALERRLSTNLNEVGTILRASDAAAALKLFRESAEISRRLLKRDPNDPVSQHDLAVVIERLGQARWDARDLPGALKLFTESLTLGRASHVARPSPQSRASLTGYLQRVGLVQQERKQWKPSLTAFTEALALARERAEAPGADWKARRDLSSIYLMRGVTHELAGDLPSALADQRENLTLARKFFAEAQPSLRGLALDGLTDALFRVASLAGRLRDIASAKAHLTQARQLLRPYAGRSPRLARRLAKIELLLDAIAQAPPTGEPKTPEQHVQRAYALNKTGDPVQATRHMQIALRSPKVRSSVNPPHIYNAACFAALAAAKAKRAGEKRATAFQEQALIWLATDFKARRRLVATLKARAERTTTSDAQRRALERRIARIASIFEHAKTDPDLASLRELPDYKALFEPQ